MSSRKEMAQNQPENTRRYTIDELLALMEPQYRADQDTIRRCIAGLTEHAAQLAAKGREEQLPRLRALCIEMAEFWGLAEDDTWEGFRKMEEQIGGDFDSTVSAARDSGHAPEMSEQTRQDILDGLERYAQEMALNGDDDDMKKWVAEFEALSEQIRVQCQAEAQINMEMGGM